MKIASLEPSFFFSSLRMLVHGYLIIFLGSRLP